MLPGLEADRARVVDLEAQILHLEPSLSAFLNRRKTVTESPTIASHIANMPVPGLEADHAGVAYLEARLLHLKQILSVLEERNLVQERLDSYKYPVLTLPNEIVSEVFMHFLPPYSLFPPLIGLLSPAVLTHVCWRWREIALSTPALWSAISAYEDIPLEKTIRIFDLWLNRSRCCPLSLQFGRGDPRLDITQVLKTLVPHRARWEHLDLCLHLSHLPIIDGPMHLLRILKLSLVDFPETDVLAFRDAPLLRSVILDVFSLKVILPWAQLTSLTLLYIFPRQFFLVLQKTSNLVHCELWVHFDSDNDQLGPDITLPYLESLRIGQCGTTPVTDLLGTFIVPALRSLKIPEEFLRPSPIDSLTGFISKSGCKLYKLHIAGERLLPQDSYRQAFPSIRQFSFDNEDDSSNCDASDVEDNSNSDASDTEDSSDSD